MHNTDGRLVAAYEQIDAGKVEVLSLDIFDTLLWRKVPLPIDVFLILGRQLKEQGWLVEAVPPEGFVEIRVSAERIARAKKGGMAEISLKEIYWALSGAFNRVTIEQMVQGVKGIINESDVDDLVAMEVALEKQLTRFDMNIIRLLRYAVDKHIPVALVSDTYFEISQIEDLLDRPPFFELSLINKFFISCEIGRGKRQGLFIDLLQEMQAAPGKVLHIGDNFYSDCVAAQKMGIATLYYPKCGDEVAQILNREWPERDLKLRGRLLDQEQGDFGLTALRGKLECDVALKKMKSKEAFYWQYGATALGPFLVGFVHWIYKRCQEMRQQRVFCLMREGRLYGDLIKQCADCYPNAPLEATELWVSRRFISHACIVYGEPHEILSLCYCHPASPFTVEGFLTYLGLDIQKIQKWVGVRHVKLEGDFLPKKLAEYLCSNQTLREQVLQKALLKRQRFLKYLTGLVDLSAISQMTLVDIGWSGTTQGGMQMLFQLWGYPIRVHGLYLGTTQHTIPALLQGNLREGYLLKAGYPLDATFAVRRGIYAMEQTATAGLSPLVDIDAQGDLVFGDNVASKSQVRQAHLVQQGIYAFCRLLGEYIRSGAIMWNASSEQLTDQLRGMLIRATTYPTKLEALRLGSWSHDHVSGKNTASKHVFGEDQYYERMIGDMLPRAAFEDWGMTWPAAYAAKQDDSLARMAQAARMEILPQRCFLSLDTVPFEIFLDRGTGFSKKPTRRLELRSNANRNFFSLVKLDSLHKPIRALRLELISPFSLVRIRSLRLMVSDKSQPVAAKYIFFESTSDEEKIDHSGTEQAGPGIFDCKDSPLVLTYLCETPLVYAVQVNFCCEIFRLDE